MSNPVKPLLIAILLFTGCMAQTIEVPADVTSYDGNVTCAERCNGCCNGEVCVPYDAQDNAACGHYGHSCHECRTYANPWTGEPIELTCSKSADGGPFGSGGCVKVN